MYVLGYVPGPTTSARAANGFAEPEMMEVCVCLACFRRVEDYRIRMVELLIGIKWSKPPKIHVLHVVWVVKRRIVAVVWAWHWAGSGLAST